MDPNDDIEDIDFPARRRPMPVGVAVALGLIAGLAIGGTAVGVALRARPGIDRVTVRTEARELTAFEREAIWKPKVAEATANMAAMHDRIGSLEAELNARQDRVASLEGDIAERKTRGLALVKELEQARSDLEATRAELRMAIAERESLRGELKVTVAALDTQKAVADAAIATSYESRWDTFVAQARLDVCEKGSRTKVANCRAVVASALDPDVHADFVHCLKSRQEEPTLRLAANAEQSLPRFARWLDTKEKATRDWVLQLCDPTLPEAPGYAAEKPRFEPRA